ncbi:MAG: alkyl hydroperoxide reductase, partial [Verrucomicrobiota bacterium]
MLGAVLLASTARSNDVQIPAKAETKPEQVASTVLSTRVVDLDGQIHVLGEGRPPKPVVLVFMGPDCPIVRRSVEPLNEIATGHDQIQFFGVMSSPHVGRAEAVEFRDEFQVQFPIILDSVGDLALRLQPTTVPEAFVIGGNNEVLYRGAIDDRFASPGRPRKQASANYLGDAVKAVAAGQKPAIASTEPVGCLFETWDPKSLPDSLTYHEHVAPIVNANCVKCHRDGQSAPFELTDYSLVRRKAKMMAWVSEEGLMPPWSAKAGYNRFVDQRVLSNRQIDVLDEWARSGAEEGDEGAAFPLPVFPPADEWPLGEPDLVLQVPEPFLVPANGEDIYRHFIIPTGLTEDKQLIAMDFRPGKPEVVHHVIFHRDPTGRAQKLSG